MVGVKAVTVTTATVAGCKSTTGTVTQPAAAKITLQIDTLASSPDLRLGHEGWIRFDVQTALVVTFPGTVASLRQMWGRAGRRGRGLAVFLAGEDALDQFFCRHPDEFLDRPVEAAILDHESALIYRRHLLCAAHEGPLSCAAQSRWRR